jgi:hypothetical protein
MMKIRWWNANAIIGLRRRRRSASAIIRLRMLWWRRRSASAIIRLRMLWWRRRSASAIMRPRRK